MSFEVANNALQQAWDKLAEAQKGLEEFVDTVRDNTDGLLPVDRLPVEGGIVDQWKAIASGWLTIADAAVKIAEAKERVRASNE
jgi:hypothetical protein